MPDMRRIPRFLRLWWHFRHDAWLGAGPWTPSETGIRRPRVHPTPLTASTFKTTDTTVGFGA